MSNTPWRYRLGRSWRSATVCIRRVEDSLRQPLPPARLTQVISLAQMLQPEVIAVYNQRATGAKVLVNPSLGLTA